VQRERLGFVQDSKEIWLFSEICAAYYIRHRSTPLLAALAAL
jgi:hypothetical protein